VNPFYISNVFEHYYKGAAPESILPVLAPGENLRGDTIQKLMAQPKPLQRTLETIEATLRNGKRVWIAGVLLAPLTDQLPPELPPAPHSSYGWSSPAYVYAWSLQTGHFLRAHAERIARLQVVDDQPINRYERFTLHVFEGWKEPRTEQLPNAVDLRVPLAAPGTPADRVEVAERGAGPL
jgi:hypothetical protein